MKVYAEAGNILTQKGAAAKDVFGELVKARFGFGERSPEEILEGLNEDFRMIDVGATSGLGGDIESNEERIDKRNKEKDIARQSRPPIENTSQSSFGFAAAVQSGKDIFAEAGREIRVAKAKKGELFDRTIKSLMGGINETQNKMAGVSAFSVTADSLASIGGGGNAVTTNNPELKTMEEHLVFLKKQLAVSEQIRDASQNEEVMK